MSDRSYGIRNYSILTANYQCVAWGFNYGIAVLSAVINGIAFCNYYACQAWTIRKRHISNRSNRIRNLYACKTWTSLKSIISNRSNGIRNLYACKTWTMRKSPISNRRDGIRNLYACKTWTKMKSHISNRSNAAFNSANFSGIRNRYCSWFCRFCAAFNFTFCRFNTCNSKLKRVTFIIDDGVVSHILCIQSHSWDQ